MLDHDATTLFRLARQPRLVPGEWRCLDCDHLAYGDSDAPRCPRCESRRLEPTIGRPNGHADHDQVADDGPMRQPPTPIRR